MSELREGDRQDGVNKVDRNGRKSRTKTEKARDLLLISELYLRGRSIAEIHKAVNEERGWELSRNQTLRDIQECVKLWRKHVAENIEEKKAVEIAKIDNLEKTYWEQFEKSKEPTKTSRIKQGGMMIKGELANPDYATMEDTERTNIGDVKWLERVEWCITQRCKILGLEGDNAGAIQAANVARTIVFDVAIRDRSKYQDAEEVKPTEIGMPGIVS